MKEKKMMRLETIEIVDGFNFNSAQFVCRFNFNSQGYYARKTCHMRIDRSMTIGHGLLFALTTENKLKRKMKNNRIER